MDELNDKLIESQKIKKLIDYLAKQSNGKHTEFRVVIYADGKGYAHVMDRDCESLDFDLRNYFN
jgi:hypothetical protein